MKKRSPIISKAGILICLVLFLLALGATALFLWHPWVKDDPAPKNEIIRYYPADFEADILENRVYLSFDRDLYFGTQYEESQYNFEEDRASVSGHAAFFLDYFHTLIMGDYEGIVDFFADGALEGDPHFTMQMIHHMRVILNSISEEEIDGTKQSVYNYTVTYEIFQNNGTWRQGVGSNHAVPQVYQLIQDESGDWKILRILEIEYQ